MKPHRRRGTVLALGTLGLGLIGIASLADPVPLLVWNASASAPLGVYRVRSAATLRRGDLVLVRTPDSVRDLAAERGYLPRGMPLVKRVAALAGTQVCAVGSTVFIDGFMVADRLAADSRGRPLPRWTGCRTLRSGEMFLLMAGVPDSFDGRYFGPVSVDLVIGRLVPTWTE